MKRTVITLTIVNVALVLAVLFGAPKAQNFNSSTAIAAPVPAPLAVPVPARCPHIHDAVGALQSAQEELRTGAHDFCGHKQSAMEAVHHALEELRQAEGCAKCRG